MSSDGYEEISEVDSTTDVGEPMDGEMVTSDRVLELWRGLGCALELSRSRAKIVELEAQLAQARDYADLIKTGTPTSGLMRLLGDGHPFVLESVCSPNMFCTMGSFGEVKIWNTSKNATRFQVKPTVEVGSQAFSMEPASGQLFSCVDADPVKCVFGCMTDKLINGIRVRATELPCTHAWKIDHHLAEDGNINFSFELTYLSQKAQEVANLKQEMAAAYGERVTVDFRVCSGYFLNVSGGRDENGTKVQVWKTKCDHSQWRIHLV